VLSRFLIGAAEVGTRIVLHVAQIVVIRKAVLTRDGSASNIPPTCVRDVVDIEPGRSARDPDTLKDDDTASDRVTRISQSWIDATARLAADLVFEIFARLRRSRRG